MTELKLSHMTAFFNSLSYEIGFPCIHRELKNYIDDDQVTTWRQAYNKDLEFPSPLPDKISESDSEEEEEEENAEEELAEQNAKEVVGDGDREEDGGDIEEDNEELNELIDSYATDIDLVPKESILDVLLSGLSRKQQLYYRLHTITAFSTWFKYKGILFPHISIQRLKEDCCDTCTKLKLMLEDDNLTPEERLNIEHTFEVIYN